MKRIKRRVLFICEGAIDEPAFINKLMAEAFPDFDFEIYTYRTNIHILADQLSSEYSDFDSGNTDIRLILSEMESDVDAKNMLDRDYSDTILAFDFDPHHTAPRFEIVRRMLSYYVDSTDMGKLYINYPMMQAFKHFKSLPDTEYSTRKAEPAGYKQLVDSESWCTAIRKYSYTAFVSIAVHNICKLSYLLSGVYDLTSVDHYRKIQSKIVFDKEVSSFELTGEVSVLHTLILFIVDYNPAQFFSMINTHQHKFQIGI